MFISNYNPVFNKKGYTIGFIDRTYEKGDDGEINVMLPCGYKVDFWLQGLSDEEYIKRAQLIKQEELKIKQNG